MILHILVGDLILESFPKKCKWLKLQLFADDVKEYGIYSDQFFGENIIRFNQTVHIPTDDFESVITKVAFSVNAIKFDGTHIAVGSTSLLCSSIEQATTKSIVLHDKLEAYVGRLTVTVFHNPTPVDLGDEILYKNNTYQPNLKEYSFLLSRRKNRPEHAGTIPVSFNNNQERSVNETVAEYKSTEEALRGIKASARKAKELEVKQVAGQHVFTSKLFGKHNYDTPLVRRSSAPINQIPKSPPAAGAALDASKTADKKTTDKPKQRVNIHLRDPPKLRKTIKSVGYVHNKWPEREAYEHDKWEYKNHLADQRRLALLKEVAEETKFRNQKDDAKSIEARARKLRLAQEDVALQSVLATKEEEIKRLRYQLQLVKAAPRPPLNNGRPSSAPATGRKTPARDSAAGDGDGERRVSASASVGALVRSPDSKLNRENSMALRLLQRKASSHRKGQRSQDHQQQQQRGNERLYSAAKARGESYTPHYMSASKAMTIRSRARKRRQSAPASSSSSYQRPPIDSSSSNRYRTSTGSSELIRSWSNDRRAQTAAVLSASRGVNGGGIAAAGRYDRPHMSMLTDIDLSSDNGGGGADSGQFAQNSEQSEDEDSYQQVHHRSPHKIHKIPAPSSVHSSAVKGSGGGSFAKAPRSSDWLANARASVSQLQHGNHLFLHDLHKHHHRTAPIARNTPQKKSPDGHHHKPASATKKTKTVTSPYAIIEKMASQYPNKHFASHPYFSDSDNVSEASSSKPDYDTKSGTITTEDILKRRQSELEAREQQLKAEMQAFYGNKNKSKNAAPLDLNSSIDSTSFSSNYLDLKLANAAAAYAQGNHHLNNTSNTSANNRSVGGGNAGGGGAVVPGFLNAFVHSENYPSYSQAELSLLDRSMDSQKSNNSLLNTANILLNAEKKAKLLPVRTSNESEAYKYNYKIAATTAGAAPAAPGAAVAASAGSSNNSISDAGVSAVPAPAPGATTTADHQAQIAAQFQKNRKFAADGGPVEEVNYADMNKIMMSNEQKERLITSQFEKNRLFQLQQQQQQQSKAQPAASESVKRSIDTSDATLSSSGSQKVSLMSPDQLNRKMEEVGQAMGSLEKRIDSFIQNSASKQLARSSAQSTPEAPSNSSTVRPSAARKMEAVDVSTDDSDDE